MQRAILKHLERTCLKCGHKFTAHGRFNRICRYCRNHQSRGYEEHKVIFPWS